MSQRHFHHSWVQIPEENKANERIVVHRNASWREKTWSLTDHERPCGQCRGAEAEPLCSSAKKVPPKP